MSLINVLTSGFPRLALTATQQDRQGRRSYCTHQLSCLCIPNHSNNTIVSASCCHKLLLHLSCVRLTGRRHTRCLLESPEALAGTETRYGGHQMALYGNSQILIFSSVCVENHFSICSTFSTPKTMPSRK